MKSDPSKTLTVKLEGPRRVCADGDKAEIREMIADYPAVSPSQ
jgi:hypothetical protein